MDVATKAKYNLLKTSWLQDPSSDVEAWEVEDYRALSEKSLYARLDAFDVALDRSSFLDLVEGCDTPEELAESLTPEDSEEALCDQIYLLVFELWRRLVHDKPSLSIFCDELDELMTQYDNDTLPNLEALTSALDKLETLLDEGVDQGAEPTEVIDTVSDACANSIEIFLYDFIGDQIDQGDVGYAGDLIDAFGDYVHDTVSFDFLRVRLLATSDLGEARSLLEEIFPAIEEEVDGVLQYDVLVFLADKGISDLFCTLATPYLETLGWEDDFQDFLHALGMLFQNNHMTSEWERVQTILNRRKKIGLDKPFYPDDADFKAAQGLVLQTASST